MASNTGSVDLERKGIQPENLALSRELLRIFKIAIPFSLSLMNTFAFLLMLVVFFCVCLSIDAAQGAAKVNAIIDESAHSFTINTPRLSATFKDGVLVEMKNLSSGEVHASSSFLDLNIPIGMGHLRNNPKAFENLHSPWGSKLFDSTTHKQPYNIKKLYTAMSRPHGGSKFSAKKIENGITATWKGLQNGEKKFPHDSITINAQVDQETGVLLFNGRATSTDGGVFGIQIPIANLHTDHRFYIPSFGGELHDKNQRPALITRGGGPFFEAPVVGVEGKNGSFGLWAEDYHMHPKFLFFSWDGSRFSLAMEHLNLMPFESHKNVNSVTWHLDVFDGGWVDAMTPYKEWYKKAFEKELDLRASVKWADKIRVIIDTWPSEESARRVAKVIDPTTVIFHKWQARQLGFTTALPDMTPKKSYIEQVQMLQKLGFKTMAYVNTYCVSYNSPAFKRDGIAEFGLTRRIKAYLSYTDPPQTFETAKERQLLYLDPLSARWRKYHTDQMIEWRDTTLTDANYEDVAGTAGDFGNGTILGIFGAQSGVAQFQELLQRNPTVPMASEYSPDNIAFAIWWPLRYQQVWGNDIDKRFWMKHMRPVSAYIFGPLHRAWVPLIRAGTNFLEHLVVGCSDALGGLAQFSAIPSELRSERGISAHMRERARLFSHQQLEPYFQRERYEENVACMYKDKDNGIYRYYIDGNTQHMIGPDHQLIYQRITGQQRFTSSLRIAGWPGINKDGEHFGLNPQEHYVLTSNTNDIPKIRLTSLPDNVEINKFYTTERYSVLVLKPIFENRNKEGRVGLVSSVPLKYVLINDSPVPLPPQNVFPSKTNYETTFPAYFIFIEEDVDKVASNNYLGEIKERGRYIYLGTGLERGGDYSNYISTQWQPQGNDKKELFNFINGGGDSEVVFDYLTRVPTEATSLRVYLTNTESCHGNGTIARVYINGKKLHSQHFGPSSSSGCRKGMDRAEKSASLINFHMWQIPLGVMAGQPVLISISTDSNADTNSDEQWWSRPKLIEDASQKQLFMEIE